MITKLPLLMIIGLTLLSVLGLAEDVKPAPATTMTPLTLDEHDEMIQLLVIALREDNRRMRAMMDDALGVSQAKAAEIAEARYSVRMEQLKAEHHAGPDCEWGFFVKPRKWNCKNPGPPPAATAK